MKITVYTLNAFAQSPTGGNPAGVVLNADNLLENQMQYIAKKLGFSETVFVQKSNKADFKLRFFTPSGEVDLCGHATIATFFLMAHERIISVGHYTQETQAGILNIEVMPSGTIFMTQNLPQFFEEIDKNEIAQSLNIPVESFIPSLPVQIASTGLRDIFVPIQKLKDLHVIKPNFQKISEISKKYNVIGYHLFTLETQFHSTAHCRNFAPLYNIPEEAATGTSNGALSCYLFKNKIISKEVVSNLVFEQGYSMKKDSEILASLTITEETITQVRVGGIATQTCTLELKI